jgi:hypothetical protein
VPDFDVLTTFVLTDSTESAVLNAPIDKVDIAGWLLALPDAEYQRCAIPDHKAAGYSTTDDGRPMSINVEEIGGSLIVQHYVAEIHEPTHCRMVSLSDLQTPGGWTKVQVIWDLSVEAVDSKTCRYTNTIVSYPTRHFLDSLAAAGLDFQDVATERRMAIGAHNRHEAPQYAASIARKAIGQV